MMKQYYLLSALLSISLAACNDSAKEERAAAGPADETAGEEVVDETVVDETTENSGEEVSSEDSTNDDAPVGDQANNPPAPTNSDAPAAGGSTQQAGPAPQQAAPPPAKSVEEAVVKTSALALALPTSLSLIPSLGSPQSLGLANTDFDTFETQTYNWDPSQEPIKNMNKVLCVFSKTGYNYMANKGPYIAQVTMSDCYDDKGGGMMMNEGQGSNNTPETPVNVTVLSVKEEDKALVASIWYSREDKGLYGEGSAAGTGSLGSGSSDTKKTENIYARVTVAEPVSEENPFGIFRLVWEAYKATDGVEQTERSNAGFIDVYRSETDADVFLSYNEEKIEKHTWGGSEEAISTIKNQAIAKLDVHVPAPFVSTDADGATTDGDATTGGDTGDSTQSASLAEGTEKTEVVGGVARTSVAYGWSYSNGTGEGYSGSDNSGSYSIGFDKDNILTQYKAAEQNSNADNFYSQIENFDPEAPVCRKRNENWVSIWDYAMFDAAGKKINHKTGFPVITDKVDDWGWPIMGWMSSDWGLSIWGVSDGDLVYIEDDEGEKIAHKFRALPGTFKKTRYPDDINKSWMKLDMTAAATADINLTCASSCPIAGITKTNYNDSSYLSGTDVAYVFKASDRKLYRDGTALSLSDFGADDWAYITISLTDADSNKYTYEINFSQWSSAGVIEKIDADGNGTGEFAKADLPLEFETFTYSDSDHAYPDNGNASADGSTFNFTHNGWSLEGIDWEEKTGRVSQWGGYEWGPKITLKKGVELTAKNTTGNVTAGDKIRIAPAFGSSTAKTSTDCSNELSTKVTNAPSEMTLPEALKEEDKKIKLLIGDAATETTSGDDLPIFFVEGELTKAGENVLTAAAPAPAE